MTITFDDELHSGSAAGTLSTRPGSKTIASSRATASGSNHTPIHSSSPIRSSPLSNPPILSSSRPDHPSQQTATPTPIPRSQRRTSLRASHVPLLASPPHPSLSCSPTTSAHPHSPITPITNASAGSTTMTPSPPLSRSHPLLGSYPLSLLHSRMSHAHTPHSLPPSSAGFALHLGGIGKGKTCPPGLRCPAHEIFPFAATYYDLEDGGRRSQTPWVGTVDLEEHYYAKYGTDHAVGAGAGGMTAPPEYPGYKVAPVGQLQILVKTGKAAVKVFLVPYDLRALPAGGRLLARERTYVCAVPSGQDNAGKQAHGDVSPGTDKALAASQGVKEKLRYSVQVQFICLPRRVAPVLARESSTTRRIRQRDTPEFNASSEYDPVKRSKTGASVDTGMDYYLSRQIKVIFTSTPPEREETLRTERADEVVLPSSDMNEQLKRGRTPTASPVLSFSLGSASPVPSRAEWEFVRRKWFARREVEAAKMGMGTDGSSAPNRMDDLLDPVPVDQLRPATPPISLLSSQVLSPRKDKNKSTNASEKGDATRSSSPLPVLSPIPRSSAKATMIINGAGGRISPSPQPPSVKTPPALRYPPRMKLRRGSGSLDERELSERLRSIRVRERGGAEGGEPRDSE